METRAVSRDWSILSQEENQDAYIYSMQLATACALPMTLKAAIELDLLEIIGRAGPDARLFPEEIVAQLPTVNPEAGSMVDRILRLLASYGILTCSIVKCDGEKVRRCYGLAPVSRFLTKKDDGVSTGTFLLAMHNKVLMEGWYYLKESVLSGGMPFSRAFGMTLFDYLGNDPRLNEIFNAGVSNPSTITMNMMLETYRGFDGLGVLVDVGGGIGTTLKKIIEKHPSIKGINFDLPQVIANAVAVQGVEHVGGDMFESVPSGDAILLTWVLHDWSDNHCLTVLKNCWNALPDGGKVVVLEGILPEPTEITREAQARANIDMIMLAVTPGGKERTERDFEALAKGAGFSTFDKASAAFGAWIMEFKK